MLTCIGSLEEVQTTGSTTTTTTYDTVQGNAQGMDPYASVGGNPETRTDPTGQRYIDGNGDQAVIETDPGTGDKTIYIDYRNGLSTKTDLHTHRQTVLHPTQKSYCDAACQSNKQRIKNYLLNQMKRRWQAYLGAVGAMMNIVSGFAAIIADLGLLGAGILDISSLIIHVGVFITDELIYLGMQVPQLLITVLQIAQHAVSVLKWAQNIVSFLYPGSLIDGLLGKITNDARPAIVQWGSRILGLAGDRVSAVSFEPGQNYDAGVRQLNSDDPITVYDPCVAYSLSGCTW